ncbi:MAG: hypothetical protein ACRDT8_23830 [Micromonosporaceae bacterium]
MLADLDRPGAAGLPGGRGNPSAGIVVVDGLYTVDFDAELDKIIKMGYGKTHDMCTDLD